MTKKLHSSSSLKGSGSILEALLLATMSSCSCLIFKGLFFEFLNFVLKKQNDSFVSGHGSCLHFVLKKAIHGEGLTLTKITLSRTFLRFLELFLEETPKRFRLENLDFV